MYLEDFDQGKSRNQTRSIQRLLSYQRNQVDGQVRPGEYLQMKTGLKGVVTNLKPGDSGRKSP